MGFAMKCVHLKDLSPEYFKKRGLDVLYAQPKLNGIRAMYDPGLKGLYTRGGHRITSVPQIERACKKLGAPFDGEIFSSRFPFNLINGVVRRHKPSPISLELEYNVFDLITGDEQRERLTELYQFTAIKFYPFINPVQTTVVTPHQETLSEIYSKMLSEGYEGIILRNPEAPYKEGRHVGNIWAVKPEYENEAVFMDFIMSTTDLHKDTFGSLYLKWKNGQFFACSGITEAERIYLLNNLKPGDIVTIKYGTLSQEDPELAVPLYPRFKCIRWDKEKT